MEEELNCIKSSVAASRRKPAIERLRCGGALSFLMRRFVRNGGQDPRQQKFKRGKLLRTGVPIAATRRLLPNRSPQPKSQKLARPHFGYANYMMGGWLGNHPYATIEDVKAARHGFCLKWKTLSHQERDKATSEIANQTGPDRHGERDAEVLEEQPVAGPLLISTLASEVAGGSQWPVAPSHVSTSLQLRDRARWASSTHIQYPGGCAARGVCRRAHEMRKILVKKSYIKGKDSSLALL
jgi:hypothetical protein